MQDDIPEELKRLIQQQVDNYNNSGHPDFEGYSPKIMTYLIHDPFNPECPVQFNELSESDLKKVPLFMQVYYLASLINEMKQIKLTATGKLPVKIVADIRSRGLLTEHQRFQLESKKQYREDDFYSITLSRLLLEVCGFTKKSAKKLELSRNGKKWLANKTEFFKVLFENYSTRFNWAYGDGYENEAIGQMAWAFSMAMVTKYGHELRNTSFYSEKYFKAFPLLLKELKRPHSDLSSHHCYSYRFFEHFMNYLGLVEIEYLDDFLQNPGIKKTPLFDKFVKVRF